MLIYVLYFILRLPLLVSTFIVIDSTGKNYDKEKNRRDNRQDYIKCRAILQTFNSAYIKSISFACFSPKDAKDYVITFSAKAQYFIKRM